MKTLITFLFVALLLSSLSAFGEDAPARQDDWNIMHTGNAWHSVAGAGLTTGQYFLYKDAGLSRTGSWILSLAGSALVSGIEYAAEPTNKKSMSNAAFLNLGSLIAGGVIGIVSLSSPAPRDLASDIDYSDPRNNIMRNVVTAPPVINNNINVNVNGNNAEVKKNEDSKP